MSDGEKNNKRHASDKVGKRTREVILQAIDKLHQEENVLQAELSSVRGFRLELESMLQKNIPAEVAIPQISRVTPSDSASHAVGATPSAKANRISPNAQKPSLPERVTSELENGPQTTSGLMESLRLTDKTEQESMRTAVYRLAKRGKIRAVNDERPTKWQLVK